MLDALVPAAEALRARIEAGATVGEALTAAREAAEAGVQATIPLQARKGRASYLGERSIGHQDPGATSATMILRALELTLNHTYRWAPIPTAPTPSPCRGRGEALSYDRGRC